MEKDPNELKSVYVDPDYTDVVKDMKEELARLRDKYKDDGTVIDFGLNKKKSKNR